LDPPSLKTSHQQTISHSTSTPTLSTAIQTTSPPSFPILPFNQYPSNPILSPNPSSNFESAFLYNPTAIVLNSTVFLLYRAQNASKISTVGLAWSTDGINFERLNRPVPYATEPWKAGGGTEDPRIIRVNGTFYLTYTAYNLTSPQLCIATSTDLLNWKTTLRFFLIGRM
jgi:predicted GH43/DUF377 family glycosyl hydrolase